MQEKLVPYVVHALRDSHPSTAADPSFVRETVDSSHRFGSALLQAYRRVERELIVALRPAFDLGFGNVARVGACALVAIIHGDDL